MYSDMSMRTIASWESNMNSARARASSVLPTPVGPRNRKVPIGRSGSERPARERPAGLVEALAQLAVALGLLLLALPLGAHACRLLAQLGQFPLDLGVALDGGLVLADGDLLDLELLDAPLDLVDLGGDGGQL